jgi:predicted NBD/HSP70 family sugar kinase
VASVVDPELVILGGGIGGNGDLLLEPVQREMYALSPFRPRIETSALREEATLYGSVSMSLQAAQDQLFARGEVSA